VQTDTRFTGNQAVVAPDTDHRLWSSISGTITADESLTSTDIFTLALIDRAVVRAKTLDPSSAAGLAPIRPLMIGGEPKYVVFIHPYQHYQLRAASGSQYYDIQKAALQGGQVSKNPIYTGAIAEYNGCVIHESTRVTLGVNSSTGAADAEARRAVLCGAQAALMAFGQGNGPNRMSWVEELFDFKNQLAVSAGFIAGMKKTRFNSKDFGVLTLSSYSAAP
jgi:N4-gp56 family major capsid protein